MTVYMVVNTGKPHAMQIARAAASILASENVKVLVDDCCAAHLGSGIAYTAVPVQQGYSLCDIVVSIGGDGTMLHAARHVLQKNTPLLGINIGRLGFLTTLENDELEMLRRLASGQYHVEHRSMLQVKADGYENSACIALNDVVLFKAAPEKSISLDIYCDEILVSRFRGDGIIFATPTGSTAYSMSAGGPIVDAQLGGIVVTQICAHIVSTPPLVVSSQRVLRAVSRGTEEESVCISCDGIGNSVYGHSDTFVVSRADWTVPLVQFYDAAQLKSIDKKLKGR